MTVPANLLFIFSDEHRRDAMGHAFDHGKGSVNVHTPNLDRLAHEGTVFDCAYTPSPICVPARASLATGRYVHDTRCWDSAEPYRGQIQGWGHQLMAHGHDVVSVGKLHYRSNLDDNGFCEEHIPMHVSEGVGWVLGLVRNPLPPYEHGPRELASDVGAGESEYVAYDRKVLDLAVSWLDQRGRDSGKPWVLFVSFVSPHYPLVAPAEFYDLHDSITAGWPHRNGRKPDHAALKEIYNFYNYADHFTDDAITKARRGYYGLTSFLDHNIGVLLDKLDDTGLSANTRVMYSSDHGDMLGDHGMWTKMVMNEQSAGIPMILRGPGVPQGQVIETPVSLVDCHQTILENAGVGVDASERDLPGHSLFSIAAGEQPNRNVISEFHDGGSPSGYTMIRVDNWKYIYYVGYPPQLFDLASDPREDTDRASDPTCKAILDQCESRLRDILDPEVVNDQAFADQAVALDKLGGRDAVLAKKGHDFGWTPIETVVS